MARNWQGFLVGTILAVTAIIGEAGEREVSLYDRMGEADLTIVAKTTKTDVVEFLNRDGKKCFVPSLSVHIGEVILGTGVETGSTVDVALQDAYPTKALAELTCGDFKDKQVIWLLQRKVGDDRKYVSLYWRAPDNADGWKSTLDMFREKAKAFGKFAGLHLNLSIQPGILIDGLPAQAKFGLITEGKNAIELPSIGGLRIKCRPVLREDTGCARLAVAPTDSEQKDGPDIAILNLSGLSTTTETRTFAPQESTTAEALVRVRTGGANRSLLALACSAELLDRFGVVLVHSTPVQIVVESPKLDELTEKAFTEITKRNLWQVMGPHKVSLSKEDVTTLRTLLKEYGKTVLGPAIKCGLAFAQDAGIGVDERAAMLRELMHVDYLGFAERCAEELRRLSREDGGARQGAGNVE